MIDDAVLPPKGDRTRARMAEVLSKLEPEWIPDDSVKWQQQKSAQTRIAILEAAIHCLAERGYSSTTTQLVAKIAKISRGAMLHHYSTKQDLIEHVIEYTFFKRMRRNFQEFSKLTDYERINEMIGVELMWRGLFSKEDQAYLELAIASRTDEALNKVFLPKAILFEQILREEIPAVFPEWKGDWDKLVLANDFLISLLDGLLLNQNKWVDKSRAQAVRKLASRVLVMLREDKIDPEKL